MQIRAGWLRGADSSLALCASPGNTRGAGAGSNGWKLAGWSEERRLEPRGQKEEPPIPPLLSFQRRSSLRPAQLRPKDRRGAGRSGISFARKRLAPSARWGMGCRAELAGRAGPRGAARSPSPLFREGGTRCLAERPCPLLPMFCLSFSALAWRRSEPCASEEGPGLYLKPVEGGEVLGPEE